jgi:hypothetical protein
MRDMSNEVRAAAGWMVEHASAQGRTNNDLGDDDFGIGEALDNLIDEGTKDQQADIEKDLSEKLASDPDGILNVTMTCTVETLSGPVETKPVIRIEPGLVRVRDDERSDWRTIYQG